MKDYSIKEFEKDFRFLGVNYNIKGSRRKRLIVDKFGKKAMFKYEGDNYICSEACSEKLCYEISLILGYDCAKIELAKDENGNLGILNYLFVDLNNVEHMDAVSYLNVHNQKRSEYYKISNIKSRLDEFDKKLFKDFLKILVFDALVGEYDRHEENWGIQKENGKYKLSPLYDNGCNLLREFKNEDFANKYYSGIKDFKHYILKSKTLIYKEDSDKQYKHFELIKYLKNLYPEDIQKELFNLYKLTDKKIEEIVLKIPDGLLTNKHKEYIIMYLKERRNILINMK